MERRRFNKGNLVIFREGESGPPESGVIAGETQPNREAADVDDDADDYYDLQAAAEGRCPYECCA